MIRLLLVDDDPLVLLAAGAGLRADGGFAVRQAATAEAALREALADPPDAIVTDVQLPDLGGDELLARLRAAPTTRDIPVIFLTAANGADTARLLDLAPRGLLAKPFDPLGLADELRRILGA